MKGVDLEALLRDLNGGQANSADSREEVSVTRPVLGAVLDALSGGTVSRELVMMALRSCHDPEILVNIVDLGLVNDVQIEGGSVRVELTPTTPGCPMGEQMVDDAKEALSQLPGVQEVQVDLVFDPPWTPDRMSEAARRQLGMPVAG